MSVNKNRNTLLYYELNITSINNYVLVSEQIISQFHFKRKSIYLLQYVN